MGRRRKTPRNRTRVFVVQDSSGSMSSRVDATITGFNEYKNDLIQKAEGEVRMTLIQFDTQVNTVYSDVDVKHVADLSRESYYPGGMTALRDAVGRAIDNAQFQSDKNDKVLVVIMTDGGENSSREYSQAAILDKIKAKRKDGWEFVFLGAGEEAWNAGNTVFGGAIPDSHRINYSGVDAHDHQHAYASVSSITLDRTATPAGQSLRGFDPEVKKRLEDKALEELGRK